MKRRTFLATLGCLPLMLALPPIHSASYALAAADDPVDPNNYIYFDKTGHNVSGLFLAFYNGYGGLDKFGYPRTEVVMEDGRKVQYFQRAVYEHWPENPAGQRVQLRLLGDVLTTERRPFPTVEPFPTSAEHQYFPETKHGVHSIFLDYWRRNGMLAYFGYPISEMLVESGYLVQYFQRARLQYHPEHAGTQYEIQLGLLGDQYIDVVAKLPQNILAAVPPRPSINLALVSGSPVAAPAPAQTAPPVTNNSDYPTTGLRYGFQSHYAFQPMGKINSYVKGAGFGWIKQQCVWKDIESRKGQFDWGFYDDVVGAAQRAGLKVIFSVVLAPSWTRAKGNEGAPDNIQDFADFCKVMASRFKGKVHAYEIWNEGNIADREWGGDPADAGKYVELHKAAYPAIKGIDPDAIIVSGALSPTGWNEPPKVLPDIVYFKQMYEYQNGILKTCCDAIGFHAAGYANPPDDAPGQVTKPDGGHKSDWSEFFRNIEKWREVMVAHGDEKRQIFITEFHWGSTHVPVAHYEYALAVSEEEQARFLRRGFELLQTKYYPWVGMAIVWNLNWRTFAPLTQESSVFSVLNADWSPRPAYIALRDMPKLHAV